MSDNEINDEYVNSLINYGKDMEKNVIPVNSHGFVPNAFIDFYLKCSLEEFIYSFKLDMYFPDHLEDTEEMKRIRQEATTAINSIIAKKNNDFFSYSILTGHNNIVSLNKLIKNLGFELIRKELIEFVNDVSLDEIHENVQSTLPMYKHFIQNHDINGKIGFSEISKEHEYFYYNKENGFLWIVTTDHDYFVYRSEFFANVRYRENGNVFQFEDAFLLPHSDIYAVSIDMSRLPIYTYESILSSFIPVKDWLIVPPIDDPEIKTLKRIVDYNSIEKQQMFDSIIERNQTSEYIVNNHNINKFKDFLNSNASLKKEIYLTEIFFDCYSNPSWRMNYFNKKGIDKDELFLQGLNHVALYRTTNRLKDISNKEILEYLNIFGKREFLHITEKRDDLAKTYNISEDILDFIEFKACHEFH